MTTPHVSQPKRLPNREVVQDGECHSRKACEHKVQLAAAAGKSDKIDRRRLKLVVLFTVIIGSWHTVRSPFKISFSIIVAQVCGDADMCEVSDTCAEID